ncbi:MAG: hypothetical protein WKF75_02930 [Singulisphaera sp.]
MALPMRLGDQVRIAVQVSRPAFLYLVWIDSEGAPQPVYPWKGGKWDGRPAEEHPVGRLDLPEAIEGAWEVKKGPAGMETFLLLARETPLPSGVDLRALLSDLPRPANPDSHTLIRFDDWEKVRGKGGSDRPGLQGVGQHR